MDTGCRSPDARLAAVEAEQLEKPDRLVDVLDDKSDVTKSVMPG